MSHSELIARLRGITGTLKSGAWSTIAEAADALQAMGSALDATATPKSLTTKREKVILLTRAQNENRLLRAQLATQSLRLEDANGLLRYVADQRDAALGNLQAMERVPMTKIEVAKMARNMHTWPDKIEEVIRATEAHHNITPPESKG